MRTVLLTIIMVLLLETVTVARAAHSLLLDSAAELYQATFYSPGEA